MREWGGREEVWGKLLEGADPVIIMKPKYKMNDCPLYFHVTSSFVHGILAFLGKVLFGKSPRKKLHKRGNKSLSEDSGGSVRIG